MKKVATKKKKAAKKKKVSKKALKKAMKKAAKKKITKKQKKEAALLKQCKNPTKMRSAIRRLMTAYSKAKKNARLQQTDWWKRAKERGAKFRKHLKALSGIRGYTEVLRTSKTKGEKKVGRIINKKKLPLRKYIKKMKPKKKKKEEALGE